MIKVYNKCGGFIVLLLARIILNFNIDLKNRYILLKDQISKYNVLPIPEILLTSIIKMEDKRFFQHSGFDIRAIIRSIRNNLKNNYLQGASTIEQQLIRTLTNKRQINYTRKVIEILFATLISNDFNKIRLLELYLNIYPFRNSKGIYELCSNENYKLENLSIYDVSEIVARIKYPSINKSNYLRYLKRVRTTHIRMQ